MILSTYNLYAINAGKNNDFDSDFVDKIIKDVQNIDEYDRIKDYLIEKFGDFSGEKWVDYSELKKNIYLLVEKDKIEVCALKNEQQYFGKGWKLIGDNQ